MKEVLMFFSPFDHTLFTIGPIFIFVFFILVFGIILFTIIQGIRQWNKNNHSPVLTVDAVVATKRSSVRHRQNHSSSTSYYVTFEFESGDRQEFRVDASEYGLLVEKDAGKLTFQGTRYLEFQRIK